MKKLLVLVALLVWGAGAAAAQPCGNGLPCGPVPWKLPRLPALSSPTPMPTLDATAWQADPGDGTNTPAPTATSTAFFNTGDFDSNLATMNAITSGTAVPVLNASGTPVDSGAVYAEMAANSGLVFGYIRGLSEINLGGLTPLLAFALLAFAGTLAVKLLGLLIPLLLAVFGLLRKLFHIIMEFLPL